MTAGRGGPVSSRPAPDGTGLDELLHRVLAGPDPGHPVRAGDGGVGVLAGLLHRRPGPGPVPAHWLAGWLTGQRDEVGCGGLYGSGLTGHAVGLAYAATAQPRLRRLAALRRAQLAGWIGAGPWRTDADGWSDYDLMTGAAGVLLGLTGLPDPAPAELDPVAAYLTDLAGDDDLRRLRVVRHPRQPATAGGGPAGNGSADGGTAGGTGGGGSAGGGTVGGGRAGGGLAGSGTAGSGLAGGGTVDGPGGGPDNGLGHGLPGVLAALTAACRRAGAGPRTAAALRRVAGRLRDVSYVDGAGVVSWPPRGGAGDPAVTVRRQAWCYGTPGVAWALWDAAQVLGDRDLAGFAAAAMATLCAAWDDERYLYGDEPGDRLGVCHGAAGVLAVADAFARHAGHAPAARLRDHLDGQLRGRAAAVADLARTDLSLLTGAAGVLAVLLTAAGGDRAWLPLLALR
jgi:hypothetical protein